MAAIGRPGVSYQGGIAVRFDDPLAAKDLVSIEEANQRGGEVEMATQVFNRHLVAVVSYAPDSFIGKIFSPRSSS